MMRNQQQKKNKTKLLKKLNLFIFIHRVYFFFMYFNKAKIYLNFLKSSFKNN